MNITSTNKDFTTVITEALRTRPEISGDALRTSALDVLEGLRLPSQKHEEFRQSPIARELEKNYNEQAYSAKPLPGFDGPDSFKIPEIDCYLLVFLNGKFSPASSRLPSDGKIEVTPLKNAIADSAIASDHFAKIADFKQNAFTAWNTAGWTDGVFIAIAENAVVDKPLLIHYINDGQGEALPVNRNLIVCGRSSEATLIEKFDSASGNFHFQNLMNEVFVSENALFNFYSLQNDAGQRYQYNHTEIFQKKASRVNTYSFTLNGKLIRNNLHLVLDGEGIESHMYGLYLLAGNTLADNHTVVDHRKPNSFSNELYKGVMDGNSKGVFNGKIFVRPQAQKTNAFQANRNILLGDKASVNTKPQLEIWADDVKCSHGCTSGQLDEEAVFYLRTRGINKETAQAMMLYAFAGEVLDHVKNGPLKNYLNHLISERLHKNF